MRQQRCNSLPLTNEIARWSDLDTSLVQTALEELPELDLELLGIEDWATSRA